MLPPPPPPPPISTACSHGTECVCAQQWEQGCAGKTLPLSPPCQADTQPRHTHHTATHSTQTRVNKITHTGHHTDMGQESHTHTPHDTGHQNHAHTTPHQHGSRVTHTPHRCNTSHTGQQSDTHHKVMPNPSHRHRSTKSHISHGHTPHRHTIS